MSEPGHLHLIIGPVGAGKSTFARRLCFELASDMWQPPDDDEFAARDLRIVVDG